MVRESFRDLGPKLLNPTAKGYRINPDATFREQISDIAIGKRAPAIPAYGPQNDIRGKPMNFENILPYRHVF